MTEGVRIRNIENEKARRRAARAIIGEYHEQQLRLLLERVRDGFARLDADEIVVRDGATGRRVWNEGFYLLTVIAGIASLVVGVIGP